MSDNSCSLIPFISWTGSEPKQLKNTDRTGPVLWSVLFSGLGRHCAGRLGLHTKAATVTRSVAASGPL